MSEFFLELFSEEIPVNLQKNARELLLQNFKDFFEKENIIFSGKGLSFSTPNRLLILFNKINKDSNVLKIIPFLLPVTYILSTTYFPQFLIDFFFLQLGQQIHILEHILHVENFLANPLLQ